MEFQKRNVKLFVLSGKAKSGKNEVAKMIQEYYKDKKCISISYAHYLKDYAKRIIGWDGREESKPRDFLQGLGIDLIKNQINDSFLVHRVREDILVFSYFYDVIIITDARLKEEILMPKREFGDVTIIRVERDAFDNGLTDLQANHLTEIDLDDFNDYDYVIQNNGKKEDLEKEVWKVLGSVDYE